MLIGYRQKIIYQFRLPTVKISQRTFPIITSALTRNVDLVISSRILQCRIFIHCIRRIGSPNRARQTASCLPDANVPVNLIGNQNLA